MGGGGVIWPHPIFTYCFFAVTQNVLKLGSSNFLTFLIYTCPFLRLKSWAFKPTTWVLTFTFTKLNLYLDLPPVIGFKHFIVLWKAYNKSNQIAQFLQRNFAHLLLKGVCPFSVFLENTFRFYKFCKYFCPFEFAGSRVFPNV